MVPSTYTFERSAVSVTVNEYPSENISVAMDPSTEYFDVLPSESTY